MDVEIRSLNTSTRIQLQPKVKEYKTELEGLKKKLVNIIYIYIIFFMFIYLMK